MRSTATLAALMTAIAVAQGPQPAGDDQSRWWNHVKTLADDRLEGRQTGSDGYRTAVAYVVSEFEKAGLKPAGSEGIYPERRLLAAAHRRGQVADRTGARWKRGRPSLRDRRGRQPAGRADAVGRGAARLRGLRPFGAGRRARRSRRPRSQGQGRGATSPELRPRLPAHWPRTISRRGCDGRR